MRKGEEKVEIEKRQFDGKKQQEKRKEEAKETAENIHWCQVIL